jgi:hypothetical protein
MTMRMKMMTTIMSHSLMAHLQCTYPQRLTPEKLEQITCIFIWKRKNSAHSQTQLPGNTMFSNFALWKTNNEPVPKEMQPVNVCFH